MDVAGSNPRSVNICTFARYFFDLFIEKYDVETGGKLASDGNFFWKYLLKVRRKVYSTCDSLFNSLNVDIIPRLQDMNITLIWKAQTFLFSIRSDNIRKFMNFGCPYMENNFGNRFVWVQLSILPTYSSWSHSCKNTWQTPRKQLRQHLRNHIYLTNKNHYFNVNYNLLKHVKQ